MKRLLSFVAFLSLVSIPAWAQKTQPTDNSEAAMKLLKDSGVIEGLEKAGFTVSVARKAETPMPQPSVHQTASLAPAAQAVAPNSAATLTPEPRLDPGPPTIHSDPAVIEEMVQRNIFGDKLYAQMQAEKTAAKQVALGQPTAPVQMATVADPALIEQEVQMQMFGPAGYAQIQAQNAMPTGFGAFAYNSGYMGGGYGFYNPFMYRDFSNQEKYGLLKIDGPDRFLHNVRVVIDGFDATVASKSNNRWNDPVVLTAGNHVIEFVREGKEGITAFRRNVSVVPMSISRKPFWLRVTGNEFDHGREVYIYRQHRYVEQEDGTVR